MRVWRKSPRLISRINRVFHEPGGFKFLETFRESHHCPSKTRVVGSHNLVILSRSEGLVPDLAD